MQRIRPDKQIESALQPDMILASNNQNGVNELIYKEFTTTVANLRASTNIFYPTIFISDSGKEGLFKYDSTDTTSADNLGTILVTVDGKRYKRVYDSSISVKWFGATGDGVTDDTIAVQKAIDFCGQSGKWYEMLVVGTCKITSSLIVNRLVDNTFSEFIIKGEGKGSGFYVASNIVIFDSTIPHTINPVSEFVTFKDLHFESSSVFNLAYVLSEKFLRIKNINCNYRLIRYCASVIFMQTHHFFQCNIRNNPESFIDCQGSYDILVDGCIIENGNTLMRCIDTVRGNNGLRITNNVIEGIQTSVLFGTGFAGLVVNNNHFESNFAPELNLWGGVMTNKTVNIQANYIYNPNGVFAYNGPCEKLVSINNFSSHVMYGDLFRVTNAIRIGDECLNTPLKTNFSITEQPIYADNATALSAGLIAGDTYRTSIGDFKIVY